MQRYIKAHRFTTRTPSFLNQGNEWIVVNGECLPIKQELEENANNIFVKQENLVTGQGHPIKQELEENDSALLVKQVNLDV